LIDWLISSCNHHLIDWLTQWFSVVCEIQVIHLQKCVQYYMKCFFFCIYSYLNWKWSHSGIYSSTEKNSYIKSKQNSNANKLFMNNCKMKHLSSIWLRTRALLALVQICTPSLKTVFTSCRSWIRCLDDATPYYNNVTTPIMDNLKRKGKKHLVNCQEK
jgi:hypothetical protein